MIKPLHDRVVIKRHDSANETAGGIIIPEAAKEKQQTAEVIAVGEGARDSKGNLNPLTVKPGDIVLAGRYAGSEIELDGVQYVICREEDILGIVE